MTLFGWDGNEGISIGMDKRCFWRGIASILSVCVSVYSWRPGIPAASRVLHGGTARRVWLGCWALFGDMSFITIPAIWLGVLGFWI